MMEMNRLYNEDCLETMARMPDGFVDCVVTSPPYDNLRDYNGYTFDFQPIAKELTRVLKPGGVIVWVIADQTKNGSESLSSFKQAIYFVENCGLRLHDTMIYEKDGLNMPMSNRYYQTSEYMFVFSKGAPKTTNLQQVKTIHRTKRSSSSYRLKDGHTKEMQYELGKEKRNLTNVWRLGTGFMKSAKEKYIFDHPAIFPEKLVGLHVLTWSNPEDIVYDPFMGSGTTAKMALHLGRDFIGSEISSDYCCIANKRIAQALKQPTLFDPEEMNQPIQGDLFDEQA